MCCEPSRHVNLKYVSIIYVLNIFYFLKIQCTWGKGIGKQVQRTYINAVSKKFNVYSMLIIIIVLYIRDQFVQVP